MKNNKIRKVIFILTVIGVIATIINISFYYLLPLYLSLKFHTDFRGASSIGIIGGADGPTIIYLSNPNSFYITGVLGLLSIVGILFLIVYRNKIIKNTKDTKDNKDNRDNNDCKDNEK